jgi:hypothetical protein
MTGSTIAKTRLLAPGIYAVFRGRALSLPGVVKDRAAPTFVRSPDAAIPERWS